VAIVIAYVAAMTKPTTARTLLIYFLAGQPTAGNFAICYGAVFVLGYTGALLSVRTPTAYVLLWAWTATYVPLFFAAKGQCRCCWNKTNATLTQPTRARCIITDRIVIARIAHNSELIARVIRTWLRIVAANYRPGTTHGERTGLSCGAGIAVIAGLTICDGSTRSGQKAIISFPVCDEKPACRARHGDTWVPRRYAHRLDERLT